MPHFDDTILRAIPEPALIVVNGRVSCFNRAALDLFGALAVDAPTPAPLLAQSQGAGVALIQGGCWHFTASPVEEGTLYLLHAARLEGMSRPQLDGIVRRLREQMHSLLLNVQLLGRGKPSGDELDRRLSGMNRSLCQMLRLTGQLDLLQDLEGGTFLFRPVTLDLAGLCREVCDAASFLLEQAGVSLCFESPLTSLLVDGDSGLLQKLLLELLANGARAAGKGGHLTLSLARRDSRAVLTLSGPGRDDGQPLTQLLSGDRPDDQIPRPGEGAGLGLVLVQRVVTLHRGTLMMERQGGITTIAALPLSAPGASLPVRAASGEYDGGFPPELVFLSDLLPDSAFAHLEVE